MSLFLGINVSYKKGNKISFKLQPIIQLEVSQKEKHQYNILTHIYGIRKMVTMTLYERQQKRHRCKEQTFGLCARRWAWGDLREWPVQVRCMKHGTQSWYTGMIQRDAMGREVGGGFGMGDICTCGWFTSMYGKNHSNIVK